LAVRGFVVGHAGEEEADVAIATADVSRDELVAETEGQLGQTVSYDVPQDAHTLRSRHVGDPDAVVLLEPRELAHLREIARQANLSTTAAPMPGDQAAAKGELREFRDSLRRAVTEEDLTAQMLVLEPLLDEFSAVELAAAATALLRGKRPTGAPTGPKQPKPSRETSAPAGPAPVTWARLYVSIGSREEVRPADLVGALAGEADIPGSKIGKIEIRDSFSIVEIQADVADKVIRAVNGTTMKGRSLRVDYDRGGPARRPPRPSGPPRRTSRRPPGS
jgi:ATP-dependent RNA helicase DeaD